MLLSVNNLGVSFHTRAGIVRAVRDVSFQIQRGETLGIVGESGSGKSVTAYSIMGLLPQPPGRIEGGQAVFDGVDLLAIPRRQLNGLRGRRIAMVFQDPMTSLNPFLRVGEQLMEPLLIHEKIGRPAAGKRALEVLAEVGIPDAEHRLRMYPHGNNCSRVQGTDRLIHGLMHAPRPARTHFRDRMIYRRAVDRAEVVIQQTIERDGQPFGPRSIKERIVDRLGLMFVDRH